MKSKPRFAFALIATLVVLAALSVILGVITMQVFAQRKMLRQREQQLQADALARSGIEIAAARLLEKPVTFREEYKDLLPNETVKLTVEKEDDVFVVRAEATIELREERPVSRSAQARYRREELRGTVRLYALAPDGMQN